MPLRPILALAAFVAIGLLAGKALAGPATPEAPAGLQASTVWDALMIDLHWLDNASDEDAYRIERSTAGPDGPWTVIADDLPADTEQYANSGLADGITYWYRVAAVNEAGPSAYSNVAYAIASALPTPPPPLGDADCNYMANSVDASLVLQSIAGLIEDLPCPDRADYNQDGSVTVIDAALILQDDAGLI